MTASGMTNLFPHSFPDFHPAPMKKQIHAKKGRKQFAPLVPESICTWKLELQPQADLHDPGTTAT